MNTLLILGSSIFVAQILYSFLKKYHIPKVTIYIITGIIFGPYVLSMIDFVSIKDFDLILRLAISLVLFYIGGEFRLERIKRFWKKAIILGIVDTFLTSMIVALSSLYFFHNEFMPAIVLGILAVGTAPVATILVLEEHNAEGIFTNLIKLHLGVVNFLAIVVFQLFTGIFISDKGILLALLYVGKVILFSFLLGGVLGFLLAIVEPIFTKPIEMVIIALSFIAVGVGLSMMFPNYLSHLIVSMAIGAVFSNTAINVNRVYSELKKADLPFYVVFFVISGAKMHLSLLITIGAIGIVYIVARSLGKLLTGYISGIFVPLSSNIKKYFGFGILAQAGVAIELSSLLVDIFPDKEKAMFIQTIVLATVVFFEIVGPLSIRFAILKAGEIKLVDILGKDVKKEIAHIVFSIVHNITPKRLSQTSKRKFTVNIVMRTQVDTVYANDNLGEVIKHLKNTKYNQLVVITENREYVGVIDVKDIEDVWFNKATMSLIIAGDIANREFPTIKKDDDIYTAIAILKEKKYDILPVISNEGKFLGIVSYTELLALVG
jgi:Kef-type K+ transport system membrane component KefB